jgi:tRNA G10  N-methylase Trm11
MESTYLLAFGRTPALSLLEAEALFGTVTPVVDGCVLVSGEPRIIDGVSRTVPEMIDVMGGTIKIVEIVKTVDMIDPVELTSSCLTTDPTNKSITFGLSWYGKRPADSIHVAREMKTYLGELGYHCRYLMSDATVSSAAIGQSKGTDVVIVGTKDGKFFVGKTVAIQPYEEWGRRDFGRPKRSPKKGMLPPKVSRMVVNISLGTDGRGKMLLDPFCGMGTVLTEAMLRNASVVGSDIEPTSVASTRENIAWLRGTTEMNQMLTSEIMCLESAHIDEHVPAHSIDAVVTEPYMGPTKLGVHAIPTPEKIKNILKGLSKLYIGTFRALANAVKPGAIIVFAVPRYTIENRQYDVKNLIDTCETLGYTTLHGPIEYGREDAVVTRQFFILRADTKKEGN